MLVDDNEFGAPWNDQFYWVTTQDEFWDTSKELLTLSGPMNYTQLELERSAKRMFPGFDIIKVEKDEICW